MLASIILLLLVKILLDTEGAAVRLSVRTTLLVTVATTLVTVSDDEIDGLLTKCVNVNEGMVLLPFTDTPTAPVEDVSKSVELTTWLCISLTPVVIATVCVNVTDGNPECIVEALLMSSVILGVVDVGETAL